MYGPEKLAVAATFEIVRSFKRLIAVTRVTSPWLWSSENLKSGGQRRGCRWTSAQHGEHEGRMKPLTQKCGLPFDIWVNIERTKFNKATHMTDWIWVIIPSRLNRNQPKYAEEIISSCLTEELMNHFRARKSADSRDLTYFCCSGPHACFRCWCSFFVFIPVFLSAFIVCFLLELHFLYVCCSISGSHHSGSPLARGARYCVSADSSKVYTIPQTSSAEPEPGPGPSSEACGQTRTQSGCKHPAGVRTTDDGADENDDAHSTDGPPNISECGWVCETEGEPSTNETADKRTLIHRNSFHFQS